MQGLGRPHWVPVWLTSFLWGGHDLVQFPLFPWVSYTLTGCFVGAYLIRGAAQNKLGRTIAIMAAVGAVAGVLGKLGGRIDIPIYRATQAVPNPALPVSYLFRTGTCLVGLGAAYLIDRFWQAGAPDPAKPPAIPPPKPSAWTRFAPLLWLGQASMTVYMVHVDLVYNIWSYPIKHKLGPWVATVLVGVLTAAMVGLAYYRTARSAKRSAGRPMPASAAPTAAKPATS